MPLCTQIWVVDVFVCVGLLNECTQVGETHYGDRLVLSLFLLSGPGTKPIDERNIEYLEEVAIQTAR